MCKHLILVIVCFISLQAFSAPQLSVSDLLDKYAANQDKLKSFIVKSEDTLLRTFRDGHQRLERWNCDFRTDGERVDFRAYTSWSDSASENDTATGTRQEQTHQMLWDGKRHIIYRTAYPVSSSKAFISTVEEEARRNVPDYLNKTYGGDFLLGNIYGNYKRVDSVLRQADSISIRDKMEQIGSVACYVVDAQTKHGSYTLWFDPEHGYNIAKAHKQIGPNDLLFGRPLKGNALSSSISFSMENVHFKQIGDIWVPVGADALTTFHKPNGTATANDCRLKQTELILNPDHDALGSFVPIIEDGTQVFINRNGVRYEWQNGEPVANIDEAVIEQPEQTANKFTSYLILFLMLIIFLAVMVIGWHLLPRIKCDSRGKL